MPDKTKAEPAGGRDWSRTLFLPKTDFPMRAGLPEREPLLLAHWQRLGLYKRLREEAKGRVRFVLHDGPPYANGNIHIGTGLNKILKDVVVRSQTMMGKDSNYVPGWDCHGLPIEWKIEEENYRAQGRQKPDLADPDALIAFRRECRDFAEHWIGVQRAEFKRLGVEGDWEAPYTTMSFEAEAAIAAELMKFAMNGLLYRGSKPVMWSVVERTALAEAEVEYHEIESDQIWVKFPVDTPMGIGDTQRESNAQMQDLRGASVVIWTTTPWTIPGNRAIAYSPSVDYGLYEVTEAPADNWAKMGDKLIIADDLAEQVMRQARVTGFKKLRDITVNDLKRFVPRHPLRDLEGGYDFNIPLLAGDHVTDETGTGFVHTAPGHGLEDFEIWMENRAALEARGIDATIPFTVDADGVFTDQAPGFTGKRVVTAEGEKGDANEAVIQALKDAGMLVARGRLRHDYPHSWRSKKPVIFRNTPQWFIAMDRDIQEAGSGEAATGTQKIKDTLRPRALKAIADTRWVPAAGERRIRGMVESRPDWVISRQRAWGVPITVFVHKETGQVAPGPDFARSDVLIDRIVAAFREKGADAWFAPDAVQRFLDGLVDDPAEWEKVTDILDVWFDSGSTHAFVLEMRDDLATNRRIDGGEDAVLYLEGSDQHRGWFQSSLLESCGTRGRAPYDAVLTHGFVVDEDGRKMSKSLGNVVAPQDVIEKSGAEILRLWAVSSDYAEDLRIGPEILKSNVDSYRKLRNTLRFLLGNLHHYEESLRVAPADIPELERYMLHRLHELDAQVRRDYEAFDFKRVFHSLFAFCVNDLSAFYFDIRKDALYCDPYDGVTRRACLTVLDALFSHLTAWLAPMLCFTMEEAWLARFPAAGSSVHLRVFPNVPSNWRDAALADKWRKIRQVRRVITGALEVERREKRIGSSLEAAPLVFVEEEALRAAFHGVDPAEIAITSQAELKAGAGPAEAFRLPDVPGVAVLPGRARGRKCARSWKILPEVGADPDFPDLTPRDAEAVRQFDARRRDGGAHVARRHDAAQ